MPKQFFTFNTFSNGLSENPTNWKTHGAYAAGLDLIGIKDIAGTPIGGRPNVLQLAQTLKADSVSAGATSAEWHLTGLVEWIKRWDGQSAGDLYALIPATSASTNNGVLLRNIAGTGTWVSAKVTSAGAGGGGLGSLSANMYYGQDTVLGQITSAGVYTNNVGSFTIGGATPRPMKVFAGVLNIGNDRYISTMDSTGTFTAAALTLPAGYVVRSLEVLGGYLVISADYAGGARIFLWTGGTATFQEAYDLPELVGPTLISREGRVYAIGQQVYQLNEVSFTTLFPYTYFGTGFTSSPSTTNASPMAGEVANWRNRILFSLDRSNVGFTNDDDAAGVWMMGNSGPSNSPTGQAPLLNSLYFLLPVSAATNAGGLTGGFRPWGALTGGIYADNTNTLKVGYKDTQASATSATYGIATLDSIFTGVNSPYAYYVTLPINGDTDARKIFHSIRLTLIGKTTTTGTVKVYYRTDVNFSQIYGSTGPDWTLLSTLTMSDPNASLPIGIRQWGKNIQFKFLLTPDSNGLSPQLVDYTLAFEPLDQFR